MTSYYCEIDGIVSFEVDPSEDINADAKFWTPHTEMWVDCPGSTGIGVDVRWGTDFHRIPESAVPEMQRRIRDRVQRYQAAQANQGA
jgi:hypothetical protein